MKKALAIVVAMTASPAFAADLPIAGLSLDTEITLVEDYNHKPKIPKSVRGIYVIFTNEQILYLGKGWVVDRQWSHAQKLTGEFKGANDTSNWAEFRRTIGIQDLKVR